MLTMCILYQRVFLEGNPYLLGITMVVSMLHSVFDFLAFKNGKLNFNESKINKEILMDLGTGHYLMTPFLRRHPILEQK